MIKMLWGIVLKVNATIINHTERKTEECNEMKCSAVVLYSSLGTVLMCLGLGCMLEAKLHDAKVSEHESQVTMSDNEP